MFLGVSEIREHTPLDRPIPPAYLAERVYRRGEAGHMFRLDAIFYRDHHRSVVRMWFVDARRLGPVHRRSQVHIAPGGEPEPQGCCEPGGQTETGNGKCP